MSTSTVRDPRPSDFETGVITRSDIPAYEKWNNCLVRQHGSTALYLVYEQEARWISEDVFRSLYDEATVEYYDVPSIPVPVIGSGFRLGTCFIRAMSSKGVYLYEPDAGLGTKRFVSATVWRQGQFAGEVIPYADSLFNEIPTLQPPVPARPED